MVLFGSIALKLVSLFPKAALLPGAQGYNDDDEDDDGDGDAEKSVEETKSTGVDGAELPFN